MANGMDWLEWDRWVGLGMEGILAASWILDGWTGTLTRYGLMVDGGGRIGRMEVSFSFLFNALLFYSFY